MNVIFSLPRASSTWRGGKDGSESEISSTKKVVGVTNLEAAMEVSAAQQFLCITNAVTWALAFYRCVYILSGATSLTGNVLGGGGASEIQAAARGRRRPGLLPPSTRRRVILRRNRLLHLVRSSLAALFPGGLVSARSSPAADPAIVRPCCSSPAAAAREGQRPALYFSSPLRPAWLHNSTSPPHPRLLFCFHKSGTQDG
jgi:hypothetical protein